MSTPALNPLVQMVRAKFPGAYDHVDDAALTKALLNKYPQYSPLAGSGIQAPPPPQLSPDEEMPISQAQIDARQTGQGNLGTWEQLGIPAAAGAVGGAAFGTGGLGYAATKGAQFATSPIGQAVLKAGMGAGKVAVGIKLAKYLGLFE